jgi:hypothetical protein
MPIVRSYMCPDCAHQMTVTLNGDQWEEPAPECPVCTKNPMDQNFKMNIGGSVRSQAEKVTEDILRNDYHVSDIQRDHREQSTPKVGYKNPASNQATWGIAREALEGAISSGRQSRLKHGSGLDILQANLKSGAEPDLIEISKRRAMRVY